MSRDGFSLRRQGKRAFPCPEHCVIINVHRDEKPGPCGNKSDSGDQVQIEMDSGGTEKLYEQLVSMANIY